MLKKHKMSEQPTQASCIPVNTNLKGTHFGVCTKLRLLAHSMLPVCLQKWSITIHYHDGFKFTVKMVMVPFPVHSIAPNN